MTTGARVAATSVLMAGLLVVADNPHWGWFLMFAAAAALLP